MKLILCLAFSLAFLSACTDADMAHACSFGTRAHIEQWSGDSCIHRYTSSGKVSTESKSDGYYFKDSASGRFVRISGTVNITQE